MPFLILGIVILVLGLYFQRRAKKDRDKDGEIGTTGMIIAGLLLIIIFGIFFRSLTLSGY